MKKVRLKDILLFTWANMSKFIQLKNLKVFIRGFIQ